MINKSIYNGATVNVTVMSRIINALKFICFKSLKSLFHIKIYEFFLL